MGYIKLLLQNQRRAVEGLFVSLIGGWALSSIIRGVHTRIDSLDYCKESNFAIVIAMLVVCSIALGSVYVVKDNIARILMFVFVYGFLALCAYEGYNVIWDSVSKNSIGEVCYGVVLSALAVLAFLYVKEDIFALFKGIKITKKTTNIIVVVIGVVLFVFIGAVTALRYTTYSNSTFDFGIFAQMYEYMRQKGIMSTTVERSRLLSHMAVHCSPIFYIALPIYFVFASPITIQLVQALVIALPVIPIVLLCRRYKMSNWMSIALVMLYALYPATSGGAFYDIHENCFLTFMVLMVVWSIEKKKKILLPVFAVLTLLIKEDAAIYLLILGAYFLFSRRDKKRGIILMVVSLVYFGIAIAIVNSFGLGVLDNRFSNLYFKTDGGMGQIIQTILTNPAYVISQVTTNSDGTAFEKIEYILYMIVPVASTLFTVGKKYARYILITPFIVLNLFTTYLYLHSITFQYNFGIIALFMYIIIMNLSDMKVKKAKTLTCVSVICASILFMGEMFPRLDYYVTKSNSEKATIEQINRAIHTIPEDASVSASGFIVPHLTKHLELYDQGHLDNDIYTDYLVIDKRLSDSLDKFMNLINSGQYQSVYNVEGVIQIYKKIS